MKITSTTRARQLLEAFPQTEEALSWHGIEFEFEEDLDQTLGDLCESHDVEFGELLETLEGELSGDEDTEGGGYGDYDEEGEDDDY
jgi:hypothetical protein